MGTKSTSENKKIRVDASKIGPLKVKNDLKVTKSPSKKTASSNSKADTSAKSVEKTKVRNIGGKKYVTTKIKEHYPKDDWNDAHDKTHLKVKTEDKGTTRESHFTKGTEYGNYAKRKSTSKTRNLGGKKYYTKAVSESFNGKPEAKRLETQNLTDEVKQNSHKKYRSRITDTRRKEASGIEKDRYIQRRDERYARTKNLEDIHSHVNMFGRTVKNLADPLKTFRKKHGLT